MKRQIMKSLSALCTGVMTLVAASSMFVSCYDDSALREDLADFDERLTAIENLTTQLDEVVAMIDGLYTLQFGVNDDNVLQYSFDGGTTWTSTGIVLVSECDHECPPCDHECPPCDHECVPCDPCDCPEISVVDNGETVTIKIGDAEFTIDKPQEILFEIRAGRVYFASEATQTVGIKSQGIDDISVMSYPKGWYAEINSEGLLEVTAPNVEDTIEEMDYETWTPIPAKCAAEGYVKVHACSTDGKCMVGKLPVIVSNETLAITAYEGNVYYTLVSRWGGTFFYGISTKESLEADTQKLFADLNGPGWTEEYPNNDYQNVVEATFESIYGSAPEKGVEYVVWALLEDYSKASYSMEDLVLSYYSLVEVVAEEVVEARTAYNIDVNVSVTGADSYVALAIPESYCDSEEALLDYKMQMAMALQQDMVYGKVYTTDYSGSLLDIAAGTTYSMTGLYAPNSKVYLLVLPLDGRPVDAYTEDSVYSYEFTTSPLAAGGSIGVTATQITEYMGEVFSYEDYQYHEQLIKLDPMTELGVEITLTSDEWVSFYVDWMSDADYNLYGGDDELLVNALLQDYGMTPEDGVEFPYYAVHEVAPNTTVHFVAFAVDKNGKYGELAKVELTSEELVKAELLWAEPYTTNLVDGVLKNTNVLEFTPVLEVGEAASYKYVLQYTSNFNPYEGMDDAELAEEIFFNDDAMTVTAAELVDGKILVDGHEYGGSYFFAIVPVDANGAPGNSAAILEYTCEFIIDNVATEGAGYDASAPEITYALPTQYVEGGVGEGAMYYYEYQGYYKKNIFRYEGVSFTVTPKEGTTVCASLVDTESYQPGNDANVKAAQLWQGDFGSWYTLTTTEYMESDPRTFNNYEDEAVPPVYLMVSWTDAEGNYYYKEYDLQPEFQKLHDALYEMIYGPQEEEFTTPDGKQLTFNWDAMGGAPACVDLGVYAEGKLSVAYDMETVYGAENLPEEMLGQYQIYLQADYEVTATDATSGTIAISQQNLYGETETVEGTYTDWDGTSCTVNLAAFMLENTVMTVSEEVIPLYFDGGIAM